VVRAESYRVLGLKPGASFEELKHAYRMLAKEFHPDSKSGKGNALAFSRVVQAYRNIVLELNAPSAAAPARRAVWEKPEKTPGGPDMFTLGRTLLMDRDPAARAAAARRLGLSGKKSAYAFLRKAFWDREERVLISVVRAVGRLQIRQSAGELGSLFLKSGPPVKKEILSAIGRIGVDDGFQGIVSLGLEDPDNGVREQAARYSRA
jgi:HEAT repeat protein